jgi:hypothetical protein
MVEKQYKHRGRGKRSWKNSTNTELEEKDGRKTVQTQS